MQHGRRPQPLIGLHARSSPQLRCLHPDRASRPRFGRCMKNSSADLVPPAVQPWPRERRVPPARRSSPKQGRRARALGPYTSRTPPRTDFATRCRHPHGRDVRSAG
eukprot:scaffold12848_cov140-Isochrysis_galbana.AAC.3